MRRLCGPVHLLFSSQCFKVGCCANPSNGPIGLKIANVLQNISITIKVFSLSYKKIMCIEMK